MKKNPVIVLVILSFAFAGLAEAAPKKRTRNQNRFGPYGTALVGMTSFDSDGSATETLLLDYLNSFGIPVLNESTSSEDSDIGYQLAFGFRFNRYFAAEIALAQYGEMTSQASGDLDVPNQGLIASTAKASFSVGGPLISAVGILPLNDKFEAYARVGLIFASTEIEFSSRFGDEQGLGGSAKGDSQDVVYGAGMAFHFNQMYSVRAEYQLLSEVGEETRTGTQDLNSISLGIIVRF